MLYKGFELETAPTVAAAGGTALQQGRSPDRKRSRKAAAGFLSPSEDGDQEENSDGEEGYQRLRKRPWCWNNANNTNYQFSLSKIMGGANR